METPGGPSDHYEVPDGFVSMQMEANEEEKKQNNANVYNNDFGSGTGGL